MILPRLTLSIIRYGSRVKWSNPGKVVAPPDTSRCSSYWKGSLQVALNYGRPTTIYLYICNHGYPQGPNIRLFETHYICCRCHSNSITQGNIWCLMLLFVKPIQIQICPWIENCFHIWAASPKLILPNLDKEPVAWLCRIRSLLIISPTFISIRQFCLSSIAILIKDVWISYIYWFYKLKRFYVKLILLSYVGSIHYFFTFPTTEHCSILKASFWEHLQCKSNIHNKCFPPSYNVGFFDSWFKSSISALLTIF